MSKVINLTIATDIKGKGGVAMVLRTYQQSGFLSHNAVRLIATHSTHNRFGLLGALVRYSSALVKVVYYFIFYRVGMAHIHVASRGSYIRKSILVRLIKALGGKVVLHLHGGEFRDFYANECDQNKKKHIRDTFEMSDVVIVLSSQWIDWAQATFERTEHFQLVYNAVPSLGFVPQATPSSTICFLGRVDERKGIHDLLTAMVQVKQHCPEVNLLIGGEGDVEKYHAIARDLGLESHVEFLGWVSGQRKLNLLQQTQIYCLPSYNEGFPMGVLEAMSAGIAVVSTYAGGIPDAITNGREGILVEAGDSDALARALIDLLSNQEMTQTYIQNAKQKFEKRFSVQAIIPQLQRIYDEVQH
ncbi:glycosyltransferase family 4 protein [Vibrio sp. RE88]|uniref:glycosyltransferase family 4 protein n=1 Tax=Vibrio sp. RE88 TaxID=2607610 RepID=UPI001493D6FC|nr:glycosyltransferase family 4 protein [Vibrio sp. RE88]NOH62276.1 glycosyltransferase family 4 protein [Vibrio sp. RE88]